MPVIGLNWKDRREDALAWLDRFGDPYHAIAFDPDNRVGIDWGVYGTPETFLIDAAGIVRYKRVGPLAGDRRTRDPPPPRREFAVRSGPWSWLTLLMAAGTALAAIQPLPFRDAEEEARFRRLTAELRCMVCQNQSLADSDAPLAADLRREVLRLMQEGLADEDIKRFLVQRYPISSFTGPIPRRYARALARSPHRALRWPHGPRRRGAPQRQPVAEGRFPASRGGLVSLAYGLFGALILIAAAFLLMPLLRAAPDTARRRRALEHARAAGVLDEAEYQLKSQALAAERGTDGDPPRPWLAVSLFATLSIAAVLIYPGPPDESAMRGARDVGPARTMPICSPRRPSWLPASSAIRAISPTGCCSDVVTAR